MKFLQTLLLITLSWFLSGQSLQLDISPNYLKAIKLSQLKNVNSLKEINNGFPTSWIKEYKSVTVNVIDDNEINSSASKDISLTDKQLSLIHNIEIGQQLQIEVEYYPNFLSSTEDQTRIINFFYTVVPEVEASYPDGIDELKRSVLSKLNEKLIQDPSESIVAKFTIDKTGAVSKLKFEMHSESKELDHFIEETIMAISKWEPARNLKGEHVDQEFILTIGEMIGC